MTAPRAIAPLVAAAQACAALPLRADLDVDDLFAWPDWALPDERGRLDARLLRAGALRYAEALRACIEGTPLQVAGALLGRAGLQALLHGAVPPAPQRAALPRADALESTWRAAGREWFAANIGAPRLRAAVCASLDWPEVADAAPPEPAQIAWALAQPQGAEA